MRLDLAIRAEKLGKCYRIVDPEKRHPGSLREAIARRLRGLGRGARKEEFWALRDVDLELRAGEVLGVIGRNGSGKSTLLKILSRITSPTVGRAEIWGRPAALLEVGAGFHWELSGRANVYLAGAVLGMRRFEIDRKFDDIVAFADVARFIDTPVKHYSSGMYVRLGFAVAAFLDAEILLVDEVLAVGDTEFQKRCLGRMGDVVRSEGRTVVFVSHNIQAVASLCRQTALLDQGRLRALGPTADVIATYLEHGAEMGCTRTFEGGAEPGNDRVRLTAVRIRDSGGAGRSAFELGEPVLIDVELRLQRRSRVTVMLELVNEEGIRVLSTASADQPEACCEPGAYRATCTVAANLLNDDVYSFTVVIACDGNAGTPDVELRDALTFRMQEPASARGGWRGRWLGTVRPKLAWAVHPM